MDTELLVEQKGEGRRLLEQLARDSFEVRVAFWVKMSDDGPWRLYIASPSVDRSRPGEPYRRLYSALITSTSSLISPSDVNLLDDRDPIALAAIALRDRESGREMIKYAGKRLGDLPIQEAYIYPETSPLRLSFTVTYHRGADANHWRSTVERGELYRGTTVRGAVSYGTALWQGETEADQRFANVGVLVAVDPQFDDPGILNEPPFKKLTTGQASKMADEMFRSYHPHAVIEHDEDDGDP